MVRGIFYPILLSAAWLSVAPVSAALAQATAAPVAPSADFAPGPQLYAKLKTPAGRAQFVQTFCTGCHNTRLKTGGLVLEGVATANLSDHADIWENVVKRLGAGEMPPRIVKKRPDPAVAHAMVVSLIADLDASAKTRPFAGRTVIRRLNRNEYANSVSDLLGVKFPYTDDLPPDAVSDGFDNIADSLSLSPLLLESYLKVARRVSVLAIGEGDTDPVTERYLATKSQAVWSEGMPFDTRGGVLVKKYFPRDAEYDLRAFLSPPDLTPLEGVRFFHMRMPLKTGEHTFAVTFPQSNTVREGPVPGMLGPGGVSTGGPLDVSGSAVRPRILFLLDGKKIKDFEIGGPSASEAALGVDAGPPTLHRAEVTGPYNAGPPAETASRAHILICRPKTAAEEKPCAGRIVTQLLRRAWRRNVTPAEVQPFLTHFAKARADGSFALAISVAIQDMLVSPDFLFRLEMDPPGAKPGLVYRVSDVDLASRMSFFLWSSMPDDRLLNLAAQKQLRNPAVLDREVRRMMADPRADNLIDNFTMAWLGLRNGDHEVSNFEPDRQAFPDFDEALRDGFETEARLFLRSVMHENRSILDVINARYTFVNERLAGIYGIPNVKGPGFRRVALADDSPRGGILGMGAILMPYSHANSTSPVYRGKWVLTNLLNSPPQPPPGGVVPPFDMSPKNGRVLSMREMLERHRASPLCSSCHARMDPYGFSLENFDVLGRWRATDSGNPVDATSEMANGQVISGPNGLRKALTGNPDMFVEAATSRMLSYALGRQIAPRDMPTVRAIARAAAPGYKFEDIVLGVIRSAPFQMKTAAGGST